MGKRLATVVLACASVAGMSAANLVSNPGFESGSFSSWTVGGPEFAMSGGAQGPDAANGGVYDLNPAVGVGTAVAPGVYPPHSGTDYAYFAQGGPGVYYTLMQTLATSPGQAYSVSFWVANDVTPDTAHGYTNYVTATFGSGTDMISNIAGTTDASKYLQYTFSGSATSATTVLTLTLDNYAGFFDLDDVSVSTATPEPTSLLLVGPAAGLLYWLRRRRT